MSMAWDPVLGDKYLVGGNERTCSVTLEWIEEDGWFLCKYVNRKLVRGDKDERGSVKRE